MGNSSFLDTVKSSVEVAVSNRNQEAYNALVSSFANQEIALRTANLLDGYKALQSLSADLAKFKPTNQQFDADGKLLSESWSLADVNKRKKIAETLANLEKAFDKAVNQADFGDLRKIIQNLPKDGNKVAE